MLHLCLNLEIVWWNLSFLLNLGFLLNLSFAQCCVSNLRVSNVAAARRWHGLLHHSVGVMLIVAYFGVDTHFFWRVDALYCGVW